MKTNKLLAACMITALVICFISCKKDKSTPAETNETETTVQLGKDQAVSDALTEDANDVYMEAATDENLLGRPANTHGRPVGVDGILSCATLTVTPLEGFPKTIIVDFGEGCVSNNGVARKGKITIILSGLVRTPGTTAVMTFQNYYVNGYKKEGTLTWTNTSTDNEKKWQRKMEDGKITAPGGRYWLHAGTYEITQVAGYNTPLILADDAFSITGSHTVTNAAGNTRTCTIIEALQKKRVCANVDKGSVKLQGPNHYAVIDYGDGTCDLKATISIDGGNPVEFLLY